MIARKDTYGSLHNLNFIWKDIRSQCNNFRRVADLLIRGALLVYTSEICIYLSAYATLKQRELNNYPATAIRCFSNHLITIHIDAPNGKLIMDIVKDDLQI